MKSMHDEAKFGGGGATQAVATSAKGESLPPGLSRPEFISIVALLMALNALAIDILLPAFPLIASFYDLPGVTDSQFTILAYLVGFGFSQLAFGPISDRFGRKAPLAFGIGVYILCAAAGAISPTYEILLATRFVQGVGAAATRVIALSIIRDTHVGRAMASTMSLVLMVFMIIPVVTPAAGQVVVDLTDWRWLFAGMAIIAAISLAWTLLRMPETLPEEKRRELTARSVIEALRIVVTTHSSFWYATAAAGAFSVLFAYINVAQPILADHFALGSWFPAAFAIVAGFMALTAFTNSRLVRRLGERRISHSALIAQCVAGAVFVAASLAFTVPLWLFVALSAIIMMSFSLMGANFNSLAMEDVGEVAGSASSVLGFSQTVIGGAIGTAVGQLWSFGMTAVALGFLGVSIMTLVIVLLGEKGTLFGAGDDD